MVKKIVFWFFGFLVFWLTADVFSAVNPDKFVRIAIIQDAPSLSLRIKGNFEVRDLTGKVVLGKGKNLKTQVIRADTKLIKLSGIEIKSGSFKIIPLGKAQAYVNKRVFRGRLNIIRRPEGRGWASYKPEGDGAASDSRSHSPSHKANNSFLVVNELDIEDYVKGILCHEAAPWWPREALKAQAVIARSYAVYQKQFTKDKDFDLTNDIYSQVYGGKTSEKWRTNLAVNSTRGKVLVFEGKAFPSYYHATCSGHTEDAAELWKIDIAPLKGVECPFCVLSPHFSWEKKIPLAEIKQRLEAKGHNCPRIETITISGRNLSGRITFLKIAGEGKVSEISAKDFRQALNPNIIRSTNFTLEIIADTAYFKGLGWGHGVGLCQWGMYFMAKKGRRYPDILKYYFPQTELITQ